EEIARGNLRDLITWAQKGVLGEVTVVVEGRKIKRTLTADQAKAATFELMASGLSHKDAVSQVAATSGLAKRELYQATLDLSHE
ncbi:MAG: 16S rRNA (cytidine(1402)-2'-O)-methyltransferase, partial [Candidatus Nanopelagicales bacterium]